MFCTRCGTPNPDEANFCRNCSATLTRPVATPRQTSSSDAPASYPSAIANPQSSSSQLPYPGYQGPVVGPTPANVKAGPGGMAITSLVLALASIFLLLGPLASIPAIITGKMELNAIRRGESSPAGETLAKIGYYTGIGVTALCGFLVIAALLALILVFGG